MFIDLEKSPAQIDIKEMHYVNNFFGKLFKQYFLLKGYSADCDFAKNDSFTFDYSYHTPAFHIQINEISEKNFIYPMRYYNYPRIDNDFGSITWVPNQGWMLGFAERMLLTLDKIILPIIEEHGDNYRKLIADSREKFVFNTQNPWNPKEVYRITEQIIEKNRSKEMLVRFLNYERNSSRELKHDLERLLSDN